MTGLPELVAILDDLSVAYEPGPTGTVVVTLPGEHKVSTTCSLSVGTKALTVNAFVSRRPDENLVGVYQWLLEQNRRLYLVAFSLDHHGDIYLTGRLPRSAITPAEIDHVLGAVLEYADSSFNTILELGFASAIRREWQWRQGRGLPTDNLAAFAHLRQLTESPAAGDPAGWHHDVDADPAQARGE